MGATKIGIKGGFRADECDLAYLFSFEVVVLRVALDLLLSEGTKCGFILQLFFCLQTDLKEGLIMHGWVFLCLTAGWCC